MYAQNLNWLMHSVKKIAFLVALLALLSCKKQVVETDKTLIINELIATTKMPKKEVSSYVQQRLDKYGRVIALFQEANT